MLPVLALAALCVTGTAQAAPLLYFGYFEDQNVTVVDAATHAVQAVIPLPGNPAGIALNPSGTRLYVGYIADSGSGRGNLAVIDTATNTVVATPPLLVDGIAFDPTGQRAYMTNGSLTNGLVSVVDTRTYQVLAQIAVGQVPGPLVVSPDGSRVYVANTFSRSERNPCIYFCTQTVSVIDTATNQVVGILETGGYTADPIHPVQTDGTIESLVLNAAGTRVYVLTLGGLDVFDATTTSPLEILPYLFLGVYNLVAPPSGDLLYGIGSATTPGRGVLLLDTRTDTIATVLPLDLPLGYGGVALAPDAKRLYVVVPEKVILGASAQSRALIQVIDTASLQTVDQWEMTGLYFAPVVGPDTVAPMPTPTGLGPCPGDCSDQGAVTVDDVVQCVRIALSEAPASVCQPCDVDGDGRVTVNEILMAVHSTLSGCSVAPTPTPTPSPILLSYDPNGACLSSCGQASVTNDLWQSQTGCCFYNQQVKNVPTPPSGTPLQAVWCPSIEMLHASDEGTCLTACVDPCLGM